MCTDIKTPAYAGIICPTHGKTDIDIYEYRKQMARPNSRWACPICGCESSFDDDRYEEINIPQDPADENTLCEACNDTLAECSCPLSLT